MPVSAPTRAFEAHNKLPPQTTNGYGWGLCHSCHPLDYPRAHAASCRTPPRRGALAVQVWGALLYCLFSCHNSWLSAVSRPLILYYTSSGRPSQEPNKPWVLSLSQALSANCVCGWTGVASLGYTGGGTETFSGELHLEEDHGRNPWKATQKEGATWQVTDDDTSLCMGAYSLSVCLGQQAGPLLVRLLCCCQHGLLQSY